MDRHNENTGDAETHLELAYHHLQIVVERHEIPERAESELQAACEKIADASLMNEYGDNDG